MAYPGTIGVAMTVLRSMVLPLDREAAFFLWDGAHLHKRDGLRIPRDARWAASIEGDVLCYARGHQIHVVRGAISGDLAAPQVLSSPSKDYDIHALAIKDAVLYAGGRCGDEVLGRFDLQHARPTWTPLTVPAEVKRFGKSVDAFVLDGDRLCGMDDILMPKWWLVYDVTDARSPVFLSNPTLPPNSTYEVFTHAALAHRFVIAVSNSMNHGRTAVHLSFFDRATLGALGAVHAAAGPLSSRYPSTREPARDFCHVDALDEVLCVSAGAEGCGLFDLRALDTNSAPAAGSSRMSPINKGLNELFASGVRWCTREGCAAVRAYFCDPATVAISWQRADGTCWVEEVRV